MNEFSVELPSLLFASITLSVSALVAWCALRWIKPNNPRIHRLVWFAVLINGIMLVRHSIELPVLNPDSDSSFAQLFNSEQALPDAHADVSDTHSDWTTAADNSDGSQNIPVSSSNATETIDIDTTVADSNANSVNPVSTAAETPFGVAEAASWFWFVGFVLAISLLATRYVCFLRMVAVAKQAPKNWQQLCDRVCQESGLKTPLRMKIHADAGPALVLTTAGYQIIVPQPLWNQLNERQRIAILKHEIAHYCRGDIVTSLAALFVASAHWFNPFAWWTVIQLNQAAEWACDTVAVRDSNDQSSFARALLSISTSDSRYLVGASGIGSSNLKARVQRLFTSGARTSLSSKISVGVLVMLVISMGWFNLRLIAESTTTGSATVVKPAVDDIQLEKDIHKLADSLVQTDDLHKEFATTAKSPAGAIAIGNRVAQIERRMQEEAAKDIVPEFFRERVDANFHEAIEREVEEANGHVEKIAEALDELKNEIAGTSEADKILLRFLEKENAATVLYFSNVRKNIRPGRDTVMRRLGRFLAENQDGKYIVRESVKDQLLHKLKQMEGSETHVKFLRDESKKWAEDIVESDDLHIELKRRLATNRGAPHVIAMAFEGQQTIETRIEQYFQALEGYLVDTADGLVINEERREVLIQAMQGGERMVSNAERLKTPVGQIVEMIDESNGEAEVAVKQFLQTEIGLAFVSNNVNLESANVFRITDRIKNQAFEESDDGIQVRKDRRQEIVDFARNLLKGTRRIRRQARILDHRIEDVPKEQIGKLLDSDATKLIVVEKITEYLGRRQFDGWPTWFENHFQSKDGKYQIRSEARDAIASLIEESRQIENEMKNDDF